jgi:hypothetical protein
VLQTTSTAIGNTHVDRDTTFCFIAPIDLTTIFRGYGPLPAVVGSIDQTGAWDAAVLLLTLWKTKSAYRAFPWQCEKMRTLDLERLRCIA